MSPQFSYADLLPLGEDKTKYRNIGSAGVSVIKLGDREFFFNDIASLPGGPMPHDNKAYMRCKRLGKKQDVKPVSAPDVKSEKAKMAPSSGITKFVTDMYSKNEAMQILDVILLIGAVMLGGYAAWQTKNAEFLVTPAVFAESTGATVRGYLFYIFKWFYDTFQLFLHPSAAAIKLEAEQLL
jgi:hypothetical protein